MADLQKLQAEFNKLARQQIETVRKAAFVGWQAAEMAAYEERTKRIALLLTQISEIDPTIERLV